MRRMFCTLLTLCIGANLQAQFHSWAVPLSTSRAGASIITAKAIDRAGNIYVAGTFRDSLYFTNDTLYFSSGVQQTFFIAKYNAAGNHLWSQQFSKSANGIIKTLAINSRNQILLFGQYAGSSIDFGSFSLTSGRGIFVAFMDTAGSFTAAREIASASSFAGAFSMVLGPDDAIHAGIYLNGFGGSSSINDSLSTVAGTNFQVALVKFSRNAQRLQWHHFYNFQDFPEVGGLAVDKDKQVYFSLKGTSGKTLFGVSTGTAGTPAFLLWYRPNGNLHKTLNTMLTAHSAVFTGVQAVDSNTLYVSGTTNRDSLIFCGTSMRVQGRNRGPNRRFHFIFQLRFFDTIGWFATSNHHEGTFFSSTLAVTGNFIYGSFDHNNDTLVMGGFFKRAPTLIRCLLYKFDRLGNMLWFIDNPSPVSAIIHTIQSNDLVYTGLFGASVFLDPFTLRGRSTANAFLARITDYNIVRGKVKAGPYCAGDSLKVPYTKSGEFDTSNEFIAELSDENGRFDGRESELGRLKSNQNGTITGRLPLLRVPTSPLYRIRIRSTQPVVQSFFRLDSLRLLIYSRDKADPGPDTTICLGDTFRLNTFGGTRWTWSPSVRMSNRLARNPLVWPDTSTLYKIIIADSSGCGKPDTADIRVTVRSRPLISTGGQRRDSLVCLNTSVLLRANFSQGLPAGYAAAWKNRFGNTLRRSKTGSASDTFRFQFTRDTLIILELSDGCHPRIDTVHFRLRGFRPPAFTSKPGDTILCRNTLFRTRAAISGGNSDSIRWRWTPTGNSNVLSANDSLRILITNTQRFDISLQDRCTQNSLSHSFNVQTHPALSSSWSLRNTDTLCFGELKTWTAVAGGGNPALAQRYRWFVNGKPAGNNAALSLRTDTLHSGGNLSERLRIRLQSDDNCTTPIRVLEDSVWLRPPLRFSLAGLPDTQVCLYRSLTVAGNTSGGRAYSRSWQWLVNGNAAGSQRNFTFRPENYYANSDTGLRFALRAVVRDGCSRPDTLDFRVFTPDTLALQLPADFTLCQGQTRLIKAQPAGGLKAAYRFNWTVNQRTAGTSDSLRFNFPNAGKRDSVYWVRASLADGCYGRPVNDSLRVLVRRNLLLTLNADTLRSLQADTQEICFGRSLTTFPTSAGGRNAQHRLTWFVNGTRVSDSARLTFGPTLYGLGDGKRYLVKARLEDACSIGADSVQRLIRVLDPLSVQSTADTTLCFGQNLGVSARASGGLATARLLTWYAGNTALGSGPQLTTGKLYRDTVFSVVLTDGCTRPADTFRVNVRILAPLQLTGRPDRFCYDTATTIRLQGQGGKPAAYRYRWFENGTERMANADSLRVASTRITTYQAILEDGCSEPSDTLTIRLSPRPRFNPGSYADTSCAPYTLRLNPTSLSGEPYSFRFRYGNQDLPLTAGRVFEAGSHVVLAIGADGLGCADTQLLRFLVHPRPGSAFRWTPESPDLDNPLVRFVPLDARPEWRRSWFVQNRLIGTEVSPEYLFEDTGFYRIRLVARNVEGCSDTTEASLRVEANFRLYLPDAFTPNGDGLNDLYIPYAKGIVSMEYRIFNRWGQLLFEGDANRGWDGTYQGKTVPEGVYVVMATVKNRFGYRVFTRGQVSLLR